jgi:hypothetical protein
MAASCGLVGGSDLSSVQPIGIAQGKCGCGQRLHHWDGSHATPPPIGASDITPDSPNEQTPYGNAEHNPIRASLEPDNSQRHKRSRPVFLTLDNHHLLSVTDQPVQSVGSPIRYRSPRFNAMSYGQTQRAPLYSPTEQVCVLHALLRPIPYLCQHRAVHYRPR